MAMIIELFGDDVQYWTKEQVKKKINSLPRVQKERYSYLMHEFSRLTGIRLTKQDYDDVGGIPQDTL